MRNNFSKKLFSFFRRRRAHSAQHTHDTAEVKLKNKEQQKYAVTRHASRAGQAHARKSGEIEMRKKDENLFYFYLFLYIYIIYKED